MRRLGEANAKPTRRWVRGNFHITLTPTLTPTLSRREREWLRRRIEFPRPFPGERDAKAWRGERQAYPTLGEGAKTGIH